MWRNENETHVEILHFTHIRARRINNFFIICTNVKSVTTFDDLIGVSPQAKLSVSKCTSISWFALLFTLAFSHSMQWFRERVRAKRRSEFAAFKRQLFQHTHTHIHYIDLLSFASVSVFVNIVCFPLSNMVPFCHSAISSVCSLHTLFFTAQSFLFPGALPPASLTTAISSNRLQCVFCSRYQPTDLNSLSIFFRWVVLAVAIEISVNKLGTEQKRTYSKRWRQRRQRRLRWDAIGALLPA